MTNVNQTASDNAEEFGFHAGDLVQEWLWDDDVDDSIRAKIEELTGEELVDEDYDSAVDGVIIWWRDGDDEDELADTIVDAYAVLGDDGPLWVLTPKPGRPGAASSSTGAVRGQDRRHERRHSADRQLRLERYSPARVRQGQVNKTFRDFSRIRKSPGPIGLGDFAITWTFRQNTNKTWVECGQNTGARVDITRDDMRFLDFFTALRKVGDEGFEPPTSTV